MKVKHVNILILFLFSSFLFFSCAKKNDKPVVLVSPADLIQTGNPGDVKSYGISVQSDISLQRFRVFTRFENDYEVMYKDSIVFTKNFSWNFEYKIPAAAAGRTIYLRFSAVDQDGNEGVGVKEIITGDKLLVENTGLQFFSFPNIAQNALNLETLAVESSTSDSSNRDIQEYVPDSSAVNAPTHRWASPAGGKFVKANTYNYADATLLTAKQNYDGSIQLAFTDSIAVGDIYITRLGSLTEDKYCVIKVTAINDNPGSNLDNYTLSVKR